MPSTVLLLTEVDTGSCEVFVIPEGPIADKAAAVTGVDYDWPPEPEEDDDEREDVNDDLEEVYYACMEPKNKDLWHNGDLFDGALELPREPVRISHIYITNAP
jgi:hypothetical protein